MNHPVAEAILLGGRATIRVKVDGYLVGYYHAPNAAREIERDLALRGFTMADLEVRDTLPAPRP